MNNYICRVKTESKLVKALISDKECIFIEKGLDGTIKSILISGSIYWGIVIG